MHVILHTTTLSQTLKTVSRSVSLKTTGTIEHLPISMIRLVAKDGMLIITGTNLDTAISLSVEATVKEKGEVLIPLKAMQYIALLGETMVTLKSTRNRIKITTANDSSYFYASEDTEEFPLIPTPHTDNYVPLFTILGKTLLSIIAGVTFAAEKELLFGNDLIVFTCMLICPRTTETGEEVLDFVAADRHHMAHYTHVSSSELPLPLLLPAKSLTLFKHVLKEDAQVTAYADPQFHTIVFEDEYGHQIITRALEGKFPNYLKAYPASFEAETCVETAAFRAATARAALLKDQAGEFHAFFLTVGAEQELTVHTVENTRQEGMEAVIPAVTRLEHEEPLAPSSKRLLSDYVKEIAVAIQTDTLSIHMGKGERGAVIFSTPKEQFQYAVIPFIQ